METDGFLNEFSFQCQCRVGEDGRGRRGLPSAEVMQDAMDGMVAENKSSAANSNNGRRSAKGRESEGARGRKGPHFASFPSPSSALLSGIISRRHLTILKTPKGCIYLATALVRRTTFFLMQTSCARSLHLFFSYLGYQYDYDRTLFLS